MSDLTDAKPSAQSDHLNLADGRILRVRRPQPVDDGSVLYGASVEVLDLTIDDGSTEGASARTEKRPSHSDTIVVVPSSCDKKFDVLDGGYGWVVVFGCFLMHVVNVGILKSFGIVFVALKTDYGASSTEISWIYAIILVGSTWFAPLASVLASAFTQRSVVMVGGLLLGLGISLSYFAQSVRFWYFSYGCLSGLGSAFSYTPAVVAVGTYFDKRRALANGMSLSGAAIGSITVPYLMLHLINEYNVSGAILIIGAFAWNVCVAGALLRPIGTHIRILRAQERRAAQNEAKYLLNANPNSLSPNVIKAFSAPASARSNGIGSQYGGEESHSHLLETPTQEDRKRSAQSMPDDALNGISRFPRIGSPAVPKPSVSERFRARFRRKAGQPPLFDFALFKVRLFLVYAVAVMLSTVSYMIIFMILPTHAKDLGLSDKEGAQLVSIIGIADIFARIGFGWFSDLKLFHRKWGFCGAIFCASLCNSLVLLVTERTAFYGLSVYAACLGASSGSYISLVAVVCVDFFGIERLSSALGSVIAFQGVAFLAGPPLISYMRDSTKSHYYGFLSLAVCLACAGSLIILEHVICSSSDRRKALRLKRDLDHNDQNHELAVIQTPESVSPGQSIVVRPLVFSPPLAHMDEFDPLTPRPVSKPVFKPGGRKNKS